jgi:hypothetical protein
MAASATVEGVAIASIDRAWDISTPIDPVGVYPKFGPLPAVIAVRHQTGAWDAAGQTRQLMLSDGGSVIEHLRRVERPQTFGYELTEFQKLFGRLVSRANAEWEYSSETGGTRIRWTYTFHPLPGAGVIVGAIMRMFWAPYMRRVLPSIIAEIERLA